MSDIQCLRGLLRGFPLTTSEKDPPRALSSLALARPSFRAEYVKIFNICRLLSDFPTFGGRTIPHRCPDGFAIAADVLPMTENARSCARLTKTDGFTMLADCKKLPFRVSLLAVSAE